MTRGKTIVLIVIGLLVAWAAFSILDGGTAKLESDNGGQVKLGETQDE